MCNGAEPRSIDARFGPHAHYIIDLGSLAFYNKARSTLHKLMLFCNKIYNICLVSTFFHMKSELQCWQDVYESWLQPCKVWSASFQKVLQFVEKPTFNKSVHKVSFFEYDTLFKWQVRILARFVQGVPCAIMLVLIFELTISISKV